MKFEMKAEAPRDSRKERFDKIKHKMLELLKREDFKIAMAERAREHVLPGQEAESEMRNFISNVLFGLERCGVAQTSNTAWYCREENAKKVATWLHEAGLNAEIERACTGGIAKEDPKYAEAVAIVNSLQETGEAYWLGNEQVFFTLRGEHPNEEALLKEYGSRPDAWYRVIATIPLKED